MRKGKLLRTGRLWTETLGWGNQAREGGKAKGDLEVRLHLSLSSSRLLPCKGGDDQVTICSPLLSHTSHLLSSPLLSCAPPLLFTSHRPPTPNPELAARPQRP